MKDLLTLIWIFILCLKDRNKRDDLLDYFEETHMGGNR